MSKNNDVNVEQLKISNEFELNRSNKNTYLDITITYVYTGPNCGENQNHPTEILVIVDGKEEIADVITERARTKECETEHETMVSYKMDPDLSNKNVSVLTSPLY